MPPKASPIWEYFDEDARDPTIVLCQGVGCKKPKVSRGKTGTPRSKMTNTSMNSHLAYHHPTKFSEFKANKNKVLAEKRKHEEEFVDDDLESTVQIFNLRNQSQKQKFIKQSTITSFVGGSHTVGQAAGSVYDIHDQRAKEKHKGILMMVIMDLQPWSIVNDPGFVYCAHQLDPHYKIASATFYRGLLDKAYQKSIKKWRKK